MPTPTAGAANNELPASNTRAGKFGLMFSLLVRETPQAKDGLRISSSVNSVRSLCGADHTNNRTGNHLRPALRPRGTGGRNHGGNFRRVYRCLSGTGSRI